MSSIDVKQEYAKHWYMQGYHAAIVEVASNMNAGTLKEFIKKYAEALEVDDGTETKGSQ